MAGRHSQAQYTPLTPVSPSSSLLDCPPDAHHQDESITWYRLHTPTSPEPMRGINVDGRSMCDGGDSKSFERAIAELVQDRKAHSAAEFKYRGRSDISMAKIQPKKMSPPSTKSSSRASRKLQADMKRDDPLSTQTQKLSKRQRPPVPQALAATHPALYNRPFPAHQHKMLPTPPPTDYPKDTLSFQQGAKTVYEPPSPSPPWRTYTDPNRQISGEPRFNDPKYRMLKMDLEPRQPKILSPTFMIGLPCGSMIEAANQYPDARLSHPRDAQSA